MAGIQILAWNDKIAYIAKYGVWQRDENILGKKHRKYALAERNSLKRKWENFFERRESLCRAFFCENFAQILYRHYTDIILKAQALSESRFKNLPDLKENSYCRFAKWSEICCAMLLLNLKRLWRYKSNLLKSMYDANGMR